ncbi:MAG: potassium channel family protein [Candidatus Latescibacterota bacterium]
MRGRWRAIRRLLMKSRLSSLGVGYLLFFLVTAVLFWILEHDHPAQRGLVDTPLDVLYWWIITCTTTGYGDISPKTQAGRALVSVMVLAGVSMVTTLVARAGSFLVERRLAFIRGHGQMDDLSDHIVICGWQDGLDGVLRSMLELDRGLTSAGIVLLNRADPERISGLRSRPEFQELNFVSGDFTDQADLRRAGVERARSVIVLSNPRDPGSDASVLLGVMAVRQLNRKVHLCAEVCEERFVRYMVEAGCSEVIHLDALRRSLAAQVVLSPGIGNVFHDLLRYGQGAYLAVEPVPAHFQGRPFADLQQAWASERSDVLLVGLLENVGNPYDVKRQALRAAQMAPDIGHLVTQLRGVKERTPNTPVLCPAPDRTIEARTQAVVIRRPRQERARAADA